MFLPRRAEQFGVWGRFEFNPSPLGGGQIARTPLVCTREGFLSQNVCFIELPEPQIHPPIKSRSHDTVVVWQSGHLKSISECKA